MSVGFLIFFFPSVVSYAIASTGVFAAYARSGHDRGDNGNENKQGGKYNDYYLDVNIYRSRVRFNRLSMLGVLSKITDK